VPVTIATDSQQGKLPTTVILNLSYYQMDRNTKRLVTATIDFVGYIDPTEYNASAFNYTLRINYLPLSHTDLTIAFALPWTVYMSMYIFVGLLCIIMVLPFTFYHKLSTRQKGSSIHFWEYLKLSMPPNFWGFFYSLVPQVTYVIIISLIYSQRLMY
jgi:hypothetical protein